MVQKTLKSWQIKKQQNPSIPVSKEQEVFTGRELQIPQLKSTSFQGSN